MSLKSTKILFSAVIVIVMFSSFTGKTSFTTGKWKVDVSLDNKTVTLTKGKLAVLKNFSLAYKIADKTISAKDYTIKAITQDNNKSKTGSKSAVISIIYTSDKYPELTQKFYLSGNDEYVLTDFSLKSNEIISSNFMAPVVSETINITPQDADMRALFVPFDNDKWVRFQSHPLNFAKLTSYEVTAIFDNTTRNGLIIGSVEHGNWKTGIDMSANNNTLNSIICYGGAAGELTRDSKSHGSLKAKTIKSPKILIGYFADWRMGLETYANANAAIAPPKAWNKAVPYGWNSWGVLQFNLTAQKALEVSDFFKNNLQNNNFKNSDNTVYIGLDSGWNSFTEDQLKAFVDKCKANGQIAGAYWTPFTDWGKKPERTLTDAPEYKYKDIYLYANGNPQDLDGAFAIDPTHPATEAQMKKTSELLHRCGFEYVKMDFMTHGALEADKWYNPQITTGIQAYNFGLALMDKYFGDMFINLSISPIFPSQYAQSRRIACDAWNKIKDTEYTMNALSYGWWIDRVYQFNDADHVVLQEATEGENRARVTSAVITGLYIAGDDFSQGGSTEGKERAKKYLTNAAVNTVAQGESFRPLEGNSEKSENQFVHFDTDGNLYLAIFNYSENPIVGNIPFNRIALNAKRLKTATNLWTTEKLDIKSAFTIPPKDVLFVKFSFSPQR